MAPPPPGPFIQGSTTPSAKPVATTASMQSPPAASTAAPTSAALRDCAATMPPLLATAGLRMIWLLENWSCMGARHFCSFLLRLLKAYSRKTSRERGNGSAHRMPDLRFRRHDRHDREGADLADPDLAR